MAQLSNRLQRLAPSATLAMSQKSAEMKAQGIDVINMSVGEPDFNTPDAIKEAAKKAVDDNYSRYSPVPGYADLRKAIVAKLKNENQLDSRKATEIVWILKKITKPRITAAATPSIVSSLIRKAERLSRRTRVFFCFWGRSTGLTGDTAALCSAFCSLSMWFPRLAVVVGTPGPGIA